VGVRVRARDGAWWVYAYKGYLRKAKRVGVGEAGEEAAQAVAMQWSADIALGRFTWDAQPTKLVTFGTYATGWLAKLQVRESTKYKYAEVIRVHWVPSLGHLPLRAVTSAKVQQTLTAKRRTYADATVALMADVLRQCLEPAVHNGLIDHNPLYKPGLTRRRRKTDKSYPPAALSLTLQEAQRRGPVWYLLTLIMGIAGLRVGEATALKVEDVVLGRRVLWVRRTYSLRPRSAGGDLFELPKGNRVRVVDLSKWLTEELQQYVAGRSGDAWLFEGVKGPVHPTTYLRHWRSIVTSLGLTYRPPHALRHTFATMLLTNGESPAYVKDQLGHASINVTVDIYGHLMPGTNHQAVDKLDVVRNLGETLQQVRPKQQTERRQRK
jgi:integrase